LFHFIRLLLFGSPLPTSEEAHQRLSKVKALAVFSSDALSSVAYSTEEILFVLVVAGPTAMGLLLPLSLAIAGLLAVVAASYFQTVHGYPSGGGAYAVARENLGELAGLVAGASLLLGYVLTVAVSITAGVAAVTSAFPVLLPYQTGLSLLAIAFVTWANLRGVRESGTLFAVPTYAFTLIFFTLIVVGLARVLSGNLAPSPIPATSSSGSPAQALTLFLIMRAFASGCTALTGVEAISNGVPAFQKPEATNAGKTLVAMAALLATMFLGISSLARYLAVVPVQGETIVSQIGRAVFGEGPFYLALQVATALILILAANTSYAGLPRLTAIMAHDGYLPRQLTNVGDRLVFTNGILSLALLSAGLVVIFGGQPHRLIPLYALGVFAAFTLSQTGMVRYWMKEGRQGWQWKATINGVGAVATGAVSLVIMITKFSHGAWVVVFLIPLFVQVLRAVRHHYANVAMQLSLEEEHPEEWKALVSPTHPKVVVPVSGMHVGTLKALRFACSLSDDVMGVVVDVDAEATAKVQQKWSKWCPSFPLEVLESPYRSTVKPLLAYLDDVDQRYPERGVAVVVLPEFVPAKRWQRLLHNQTALLLKSALIYRRGLTGKGRVVVSVPYHLHR